MPDSEALYCSLPAAMGALLELLVDRFVVRDTYRPNITVDLDFQQALVDSTINL